MLSIGRAARVAAGVAVIAATISASSAASSAVAGAGRGGASHGGAGRGGAGRGGAGRRGAAGGADKRVAYRGYTFLVPRSWPVIDIGRRQHVCVRFDQHALYLGSATGAGFCPSWLLGTTESMLVQPGPIGAATTATVNRVARTVTVDAPRIVITATYDSTPAVIWRILGAAGFPQPRAGSGRQPAGNAARAVPFARRSARSPAGMPAPDLPADVSAYHGLGFDACAAPGQQVMNAWLHASRYRAIGIYIGGSDRACPQPNLTASWVRTQAVAGWRFIPLYAGPQAAYGELNAPVRQGVAAATDAVTQALSLGFGPGTPIYYDMEAYLPRRRAAALAFLSAWSGQVRRLGYLAGVYSSSDSGVADLVKQYGRHQFGTPDIIYDALWNGKATVTDPNIPAGLWVHRRIHQFSGNVTQRHGGRLINIDQDYLDVQIAVPVRTPQPSAAVSLPGGRAIVFYRGAGGRLWFARYRATSGWTRPVRSTTRSLSAPSVAWTGRVVDVFYRGLDGYLWVDARRAGGGLISRNRLTMMGTLGTGPLAVTQAGGVIDVFWRGSADDHLWHAQDTPGAGWQGPQDLGGSLASPPAPVASAPGRTLVFWQGTDGDLWTVRRGLDGRWSAPATLGMGPLGSQPVATAQPDGGVEVYWKGSGNSRLWEAFFRPGTGWRGPRDLGGALGSAPWPATAGGGVRVFWIGRHGRLYARQHRPGGTWNLAGWRGENRLHTGSAIAAPFAATGDPKAGVWLFWVGRKGALWTSVLTSSGWARPRRLIR